MLALLRRKSEEREVALDLSFQSTQRSSGGIGKTKCFALQRRRFFNQTATVAEEQR